MIHTFQCPNCGASLDYETDSRALTIRCAYCRSTVIVPESLRAPGADRTTLPPQSKQSAAVLEIKRLVGNGQKIAAIKLFRETFHVGLKEAKLMVEAIERNEAVDLGNLDPDGVDFDVASGTAAAGGTYTDPGRGGSVRNCLTTIVLLLIVSGVLAYLYLSGRWSFGTAGDGEALVTSLMAEMARTVESSLALVMSYW